MESLLILEPKGKGNDQQKRPLIAAFLNMVATGGLEPPTPAL